MDRADQIAEKIYLGLVMWISADVDREWRQNILIGIAAALREYGDERLEEAAHIVELKMFGVHYESLKDDPCGVLNIACRQIRALKTPPSEGKGGK